MGMPKQNESQFIYIGLWQLPVSHICTHALSCCNVQGLKVLDLRLNRGLKQSADEYKSKIILRLSQIISQLHVVYVKELMVIR